MVLLPVKCPVCNSIDVTKHGTTSNGKQRFICKDPVWRVKHSSRIIRSKVGYQKRNNKSLR